MNQRTLLDLSDEEFDTLIEEYIERGSQQTDDLDADIFFDALADFVAASPETPLELNGKWHEGEFILTPEGSIPPEVEVHRNRIITPDFTFVIRLEQDQAQPNGQSITHYPKVVPTAAVPYRHPVL